MTDMMKKILAASLALATVPLAAQEPWDPHIKITAGFLSNAENNLIGQDKAYGATLAGAYPLSPKSSAVVEFGYRFLPPASISFGMSTIDDKSDAYYLGAMYRRNVWRNGIYLQGGARVSNALTVRKIIYQDTLEDTRAWDKIKGDREVQLGWCLAAGYRMTGLWSVELSASSAAFKNVEGASKTGVLIEAALLIHR